MREKRKTTIWRKACVIGGTILAVMLVLMAIGLGCGGGRKSAGPTAPKVGEIKNGADRFRRDGKLSSEGYEEAEKYAVVPEKPGNVPQAQTRGTTKTQASEVPPVQTKTIRTGTLSIEIKKGTFNSQYGKVSLIAEGVGGYVSDSRSDSESGRLSGGTVTVRVPNDSYPKVMEELKKIGKVTAVSEQAQDVTEEYIDLESRVDNLRAQEAVYLRLMAKAQTIEESISVQRELSVIQSQIEQLTGRKNYLDNRVQFSTIKVTLLEPGAVVSNGGGWGFTKAISDAAHGVVNGLNAVVRFLGNASIYIVIIAVIAFLVYMIVRKKFAVEKAE